MAKMTTFECCQLATQLTAIACEGIDNIAEKIVVSPDGKLDDNAKAENWFVAEVFKVFLFFVIDMQKTGGLLDGKDTAPDAGSILGGFKPILDKLLPLLPGNAGTIAQSLLSLLSGLGSGGTTTAPVEPIPPLTGNS